MGFTYTEDDADIGSLVSARVELDRIYTKLRGETVEYKDIISTTATEFTDLISENIESVATENQEAWQGAMLSCVCAYGVIDKWIEDVRWYRNRIEELLTDFGTATAGVEDITEYSTIRESYSLQAKQAYEQLEERAEACSDMLADGPTPETVRQLIEAGHMGIAPYAITGDTEYYPFAEQSGEELAEQIRTGSFDGNYEELLEAALDLAERSASSPEDGEELAESELEFLEALLEGTDDFLLELHDDGFRGDPSDFQQQEIAALLGMSIVGLSHPGNGGGHDRLPESVHNLAEGPGGGQGYHTGGPNRSGEGYGRWLEDAQGLAFLLDEARHPNGSPMELGEETSLKLTTAVGEVAAAFPNEHERNELKVTYTPDEQENATMSRILDFSTANEDANHTLLTEDETNGQEREQILADLYTFDWEDDGHAVSGLTDWIADGENSTDPSEPDRSNEAFVGLMDIMADEGMQEQLSRTGQDVDDTMIIMDPDGEKRAEEFSWKDVSIGHLNPELAGGFADLFDSKVDAFADLTDDGDKKTDEGVGNSYEGGEITIDREAKEAFTQIIAGSQEAAGQMLESTVEHNESSLEEYMSQFKGSPDENLPAQAGNLWGLVDDAIVSEADRRIENHNGQVDEENDRNSFIRSIAGSYIPNAQVGAFVDQIGQDIMDGDHVEPNHETEGQGSPPGEETADESLIERRAKIHAISALAERDEGYEDQVDPRMKPGGDEVSTDPSEWTDYDDDRDAEFHEETGRDPQSRPEKPKYELDESWENLRNLEWPDDRTPGQIPDTPEGASERRESFDTSDDYVRIYVDKFQQHA